MSTAPQEKTAQQLREESLGWKDITNPFPFDALLRMHNWKIHTRKKGEEPLWCKYVFGEGLEILPESMALVQIPAREVSLAEKYLDSYSKRTFG